jgi:PAS domain S-box-containing protein
LEIKEKNSNKTSKPENDTLEHAAEKPELSYKTISGILDSIQDDFYVLDREWNFVYASRRFASRIGKEPEDLVGNNLWKMFPKHLGTVLEENFRAAMDNREVRRFEVEGKSTDKWYSMTAFPSKEGITVLGIDVSSSKKDEEKLKQQAFLIDLTPDAIIAMNPEGNVTFWNAGAEKLYGWKKNEVLNSKIHQLLKTKFSEPIENIMVKLKKDGFWNGELVQVSKEGKEIIVESRWLPKLDAEGQIIEILKSNVGITDRKKAEESLKKMNEKLEDLVGKQTKEVLTERRRLYSILETLPVYVILLDKDYTVPFANKVFRKLFGESHGRRCFEYLFNRDSPCETCETYKVLKTNAPHHWEWTGPNGRDYDIFGYPFVEADGSTLILEMGIDITERNLAEKQIRDSSLYSRSLIEASLDPLVTINAQGKITDVNKATELATGCSRNELIGSNFSDYFVEPEKAKIGYKQVFFKGQVKDYPLAIKNKNGKITEVLYNAVVYTNNAGEIQGVFAAARDVTDRKKAEEKAQETAKKLKDAERLAAIGATAGMVGHDIRNPLQAIIGDLYLAKAELAAIPDSAEKKNMLESLDEIEKNTDYINKIVQDLQDYARPLNPQPEKTNLEQIIEKLLAKNVLPKNVKLTIKVEGAVKKINVDSYYINRILYNLVNNSVQAMPNGGNLTITAHKEADNAVISVKDTGIGIPKEIQSKMFTPMFTTKSKGQGFGLPVVKRMTESLCGTVSFESQEGKGTTFTIRLPLKN